MPLYLISVNIACMENNAMFNFYSSSHNSSMFLNLIHYDVFVPIKLH